MFKLSFYALPWIFLISNCIRSEDDVKCELGAFLENTDGTEPALIDFGPVVPDSSLKSCKESAEICAKFAETQAFEGTNGGNFTLYVDDKNGYTVGDVLCDKADAVHENVRNKIVHIYWRLCGSEWQPTPFRMPELLCCEDGLYVPCKKLKTEL